MAEVVTNMAKLEEKVVTAEKICEQTMEVRALSVARLSDVVPLLH